MSHMTKLPPVEMDNPELLRRAKIRRSRMGGTLRQNYQMVAIKKAALEQGYKFRTLGRGRAVCTE